MKFWDYCKDRAGVLLANAAGLLVLSVYLLLLNTTGTAVFLIDGYGSACWQSGCWCGGIFEENIFRRFSTHWKNWISGI